MIEFLPEQETGPLTSTPAEKGSFVVSCWHPAEGKTSEFWTHHTMDGVVRFFFFLPPETAALFIFACFQAYLNHCLLANSGGSGSTPWSRSAELHPIWCCLLSWCMEILHKYRYTIIGTYRWSGWHFSENPGTTPERRRVCKGKTKRREKIRIFFYFGCLSFLRMEMGRCSHAGKTCEAFCLLFCAVQAGLFVRYYSMLSVGVTEI